MELVVVLCHWGTWTTRPIPDHRQEAVQEDDGRWAIIRLGGARLLCGSGLVVRFVVELSGPLAVGANGAITPGQHGS